MATYTISDTGRHYAPQRYNRTTRRWLDGGPDLAVEIHDDDSGAALGELSLAELIAVAGFVADSERDDVGELADAVVDEINVGLDEICERIAAWDGEDARELAALLNDADEYARKAGNAFEYVPGRPYGYEFKPGYDVTSLGWHGEESAPGREDTYACDKRGVLVVLVVGTTDEGWTTESPE